MRRIRIGTIAATFTLLALIAPGCGDDDGGDGGGGSGGASGGSGGAKGGSGGAKGGTAGANTGGSKGGSTTGGSTTGGSNVGGDDNTGGTPEGGSPGTGGINATGGTDDGTGGTAEGGMAGSGGAGAMSGGGSGGDGGVGGAEGGAGGVGGAGGEGGSCEAGYVACKGNCIDPLTDPDFCGASGACNTTASDGRNCANNQTCQRGICCGAGLINCGGDCVDPLLDEDFCGAEDPCDMSSNGDVCLAGPNAENCSAGHCCPADRPIFCGGKCIDPLSEEDYCGARDSCNTDATDGMKCGSGLNCVEGVCCNIAGGMVVCDGKCINPLIDEAYCGADAPSCEPDDGTNCSGAENVCCEGGCINPLENDEHCGATVNTNCAANATGGTNCAATGDQCTNGHCCDPGLVWCGTPGACINPQENDDFCGVNEQCVMGAGPSGAAACADGFECNGGQCEAVGP